MAICRPPRSISPPSPVHLFHGILILGSGRKAPYVSIRILCALKWRCNSPGIHSVTRDNVVLRVKGTPLKGQLLKQEVCELIAKPEHLRYLINRYYLFIIWLVRLANQRFIRSWSDPNRR